jgi:hypothetical protein
LQAGLQLATSAVGGRIGTVSGRVHDTTTGSGLPGAMMHLSGTGLTATTDERGYYRFAAVPPGNDQLSSVEARVASGGKAVQDFETGAPMDCSYPQSPRFSGGCTITLGVQARF